jgi:hypothetical protein
MSVYDLYQSYLNAQKQVAPSLGILDPRLLYPQNYQGDGDGQRGGGDFGNLDMSDTKDFFINGEVVPGYRNLTSGLYQDLQGKNIQNLGIRNLPGITGLLDKMRGDRQIKYPGYFDYYNVGDLISNPRSFSDFFKSQTPSGADIARYRGLQKKTMQEAKDITQRIQKQTPGGGGGGGGRSFSPSPSPSPSKTSGGSGNGGAASRGGGASYGTRKESGWKSSPF